MDKSEILVHISAPSGAADDARYRAQVEGILDFQSHSRETITLKANNKPQSNSASSTSRPLPQKTTATTTKTIDSPPLRGPTNPSSLSSQHVAKRQASFKDSLDSPVSVIPDSQPQQFAPIADSLHLTPLPYSPALLPSKRPRVDSPPALNQSDPAQAHHGTENQIPATHASATITGTSSTPVLVEGREEREQDRPSPDEKKEGKYVHLTPLPLEIKPPPPPISTSPFTTHITPTLEMLSKRLKSPRTYNPLKQTRELDKLERGCWYLRINIIPPISNQEGTIHTTTQTGNDPKTWDITLFSKFWAFLSDFIAKEGRAGWGVWCILENENERTELIPAPSQGAEGGAEATELPSNTQSRVLKVYAWGEVACHIYLLLFLASERRIRKMGAQWRDARDEVIIQMP